MDTFPHSLNRKSPTKIVVIVNSESTIAEPMDNPSFEATNPKVIKTKGEITINNRSHIENLPPLFVAQITLIELANNAMETAPRI